jgi:hypothetical protein
MQANTIIRVIVGSYDGPSHVVGPILLRQSDPDVGSFCLRYAKVAPLCPRIAASLAVKLITGRPRSSQISPAVSRRDNRE